MRGRFRSFDFWDGVVFGFAVATTLSLVTAWLLLSSQEGVPTVLATLLTIPVAGLVATVTLYGTRFQIAETRRQDNHAARAVLPLALSRAISAAQSGIRIAAGVETPSRQQIIERLSLSDRTIDILRDNVRACDPTTREWLEVMIARYQVYYSRLESWIDTPPPYTVAGGLTAFVTLEREDALKDWATFHTLVEHFYEYARGAVPSAPKTLDFERQRSAYKMHLFGVEFTHATNKRIEDRLERLRDGSIKHFRFNR